ncbi:Retrotransposon-derived protein PEG10 [Ceratobasidium sp. AG-Ba]|nr:Retrotransposon-derived protein PEG10 [Ceratobasidium sp. AG-Ba]QRW10895.1 Retrotransposon-derived protein PEG10 [Ceratobasidium sp. AG-Ba]
MIVRGISNDYREIWSRRCVYKSRLALDHDLARLSAPSKPLPVDMNRTNYDEDVRQRAQRSKQSLAQAAGEEAVCDCVRCYGQGILRPIATVKTHRSRYGRHVPGSHAEVPGHHSNDPDNEPPAREDSDEDMADNFAPAPAPPRPHSPSHSRSRSPPAGPHPRSCSRSRSQSPARSMSRSRSHSMSRSASRLGSPARSRSGSEADEIDIRLRVIDANEDALFYQNLLHENRVNRLPPLNVHRDNELDIQIQPHDEVQADGEANQSGDEAPDQNIDIPGEPGGEPAQPINHAEIFVPPPDLGGDLEPPDEEDRYAAFGEHPTLRNIYFRTWIRAAFYVATHDDIQATLESHKLSLESLTHIAPLPDDFLENIGKMPRTLRSLERRIGMDFSGLLTVYVLCPDCGKRYSPEHFANLHGPQCVQHHAGVQCEGIV